jgi:sugar phosphate isomerase/epimerase
MSNLARRDFLKNLGAASAVAAAPAWATGVAGASPAAKAFKLGGISDGFSMDFEEALKALKGFGLDWVEIRNVYGKYNTEASPEEIKKIKGLLSQYGFRVSTVDTALFKCTLPGTNPAANPKDLYAYSDQMDLLKRAADRAHTWGADKLRGFAFWRVADPGSVVGQVAEELDKAAEVAHAHGMRIVIEDEPTTNVGTAREMARLMAAIKASNVGINWDVGNGNMSGEVSYPTGYELLPKNRIWHVHLKGVACAPGLKNCKEAFADEGSIDLVGQLRALRRDQYTGTMSLECEYSAPGMSHAETTKRSMEGLLKVVAKATA